MKPHLLVLVINILLCSNSLWAQVPNLDGISDSDLDTVVKEFAANFVHTSATPPTSLGKVFGVEAAMIVGLTQSPGVKSISQQIDPSAEAVEHLPHAWLLGGFSVPYGISVELNFLPDVDLQDFEMSHTSVAVKWSVTDQFFKNLPFDIAVRTYYTRSEFSYSQSVNNISFPATSNIDVSFNNSMVGGDTLIGFDIPMVEPYFGFGFVNTRGRLAGDSQTSTPYSLFEDQLSREKESVQDSMRIIAGARVKLAMMNVGLEYSHVFDVSRLSAKIGMQF